ncbi:hypothetical protein C1N55_01215 [Lysinibacillus sp. SGAir0095]|nr:hypothetical protein C1N55_01215 [Lysinibacillus sp. SGAir0095]
MEGARPASKTTGEIDQRTLFVLAGDLEVVEELAPAARQKEKRKVLVQLCVLWQCRHLHILFMRKNRPKDAISI